jgi:exopolyphosphatase/guanosine-5'-triphosphate,3'-diphosphate pyrophosphatase
MARYAAVDIGSNSVRMMAAEVSGGKTQILAQDREVTRLGESVFRDGVISKSALDFLCATLARMSVTYSRLDVAAVRAVATSAVRDAGNQDEFVERVNKALGANVEIISGPEEARLIHLGVEAQWPRPEERTLIIDVGGGSAELIVSQHGELVDAVSKPLGAVRLTQVFLESDPPKPEELHRLHRYVDEKLSDFYRQHGAEPFDRVIATSATAAAIVCGVNEVPRAKRDTADRVRASTSQIQNLYEKLSGLTVGNRRKIAGIGPRRAEIVVAGSAVFLRALELFGHRSLYYCIAGVRDGIIADLATQGAGQEITRLSSEQTAVVKNMAKRYGVAAKHADVVARLGRRLFDLLRPLHQLPPSAGKVLEAAAYLHDIGHYVSATGHHKHSAYLVANSDMPGFTGKERLAVAALCRFHRKSMPQIRHSHFQMLDSDSKRVVLNLIPLLRIADSLDRGHEQKVLDITGASKNGSVTLQLQTEEDSGLELWAAEAAAEVFQQIFSKPLQIERTKPTRASVAKGSRD